MHMLPKLSSACYAIRCMYNCSDIERIKIILCILLFDNEVLHSILGIILWTLEETFNYKEKCENYDVGLIQKFM